MIDRWDAQIITRTDVTYPIITIENDGSFCTGNNAATGGNRPVPLSAQPHCIAHADIGVYGVQLCALKSNFCDRQRQFQGLWKLLVGYSIDHRQVVCNNIKLFVTNIIDQIQ
ncbi:TPA: hypothetical protein QEN11_23480 [Stenotrophomonas maltophilia]|nr:hypothetical protein [Stenotrophomonas maltophilia]HEP1209802.1 hypothetical protein [Stenotrophomonas maltophilia]